MNYKILLIILFFIGLSSCSYTKVPSRPNIVVLLVDDAGYADFGFMGSKDLETPNLDRLASDGMIFTDAHVSASVCAPSRAGLLTGRYQQRFGFECNALSHFKGIDTSEVTIAEVLKTVGYKTAAFGKWHVGDLPCSRPNNRGFDYSYTFLSGARSYFPNEKEDKEGHLRSIRENGVFSTFDGYLTDVLGEKAVDFIDNNKSDPFFIYWSPNAVHTPMEATQEDLQRYNGHPRQELAAMTWALDRAVGKIIDKLKSENLLNNTLIFFLSDNGGAVVNQSSNLPLKGYKGNKFEGGHRVAFFAHWPKQIKANGVFDGLTSSMDIFSTVVDISGAHLPKSIQLDGITLKPFLTGAKTGNPHNQLFWRKEGMAAMRENDFKMIRVDSLGYRLYNLDNDIGEKDDLCEKENNRLVSLQQEMQQWEKGLIEPLWLESDEWNEVTWWVHRDLYFNHEVQVKSPGELEILRLKSDE